MTDVFLEVTLSRVIFSKDFEGFSAAKKTLSHISYFVSSYKFDTSLNIRMCALSKLFAASTANVGFCNLVPGTHRDSQHSFRSVRIFDCLLLR